MRYLLLTCLMGLTLSTLCTNAYAQELGKRNLANPDTTNWKKAYSTANGEILSSDETKSKKGKSLHIAVHFDGKGFTYYNTTPNSKTNSLPGDVRKVRIVAKTGGDKCGWKVSFKVDKPVKGKKYEWKGLRLKDKWSESTFEIPAEWPRVIGVNVSANNWNTKWKKTDCDLFIETLEASTDISDVKDKSKLLSVEASTGRARNIFKDGEKIRYTVSAGSWYPKVLSGKLSIDIIDPRGKKVYSKSSSVQLDDGLRKKLSYKPELYGVYTVKTKMDFGPGKVFEQDSQCASIPPIPQYTKEEQRYAPWAINIHGGMEGVAYKSIRTLGFQWIRDYAYNEDWLKRGRNKGLWDGWPWYLPMNKKIEESGLMVLPSMVYGIDKYIKDHPKPPENWMDNIVHFMLKFPKYQAFEIDNELDLHRPILLKEDDYQSYGLYHQSFAKIVKALRPKAWAVEQGHAGIKAHMIEKAVSRGHFDDIDVVNAHFYCGTSPALMAKKNANTGQSGEMEGNIYDQLRRFVRASDMDGKDRQAWLTEFGWDTLAVHIVDEHTQASYTQRGYAMGLSAGLDKMFLYWNRDTKKKPKVFFDGMGIFDPQDEPKPVASAMAAMIHFLKMPKVVGTFHPGDNGYGYVFKDRGRLVGMAFKIDPEKPGPKVTFKTGDLHDIYGNPITGRTHTLDIDAVWIDNIKADDPFVMQTDYSQESNTYIRGAAGDVATLNFKLSNSRNKAYTVNATAQVPNNWTPVDAPKPVTLKPGETKELNLKVKIDQNSKLADQKIWTTLKDEMTSKKILTEVQVVPAASLGTITLTGRPGTTTLPVTLSNNSLSQQSYTVTPTLPKGWKATPSKLVFSNMKGSSKATQEMKVTWSTTYRADTPAKLNVSDAKGANVYSQGIIPSGFDLQRANKITFDGDFSDWPANSELPSWIIGSNGNPEVIKLRTAYSKEGIYVGLEVAPSDAKADNPSWFWTGDVLEICIDTLDNKNADKRTGKNDLQFWFVPQVKEGKAYLGQWKRRDEIEKSRYDIPTQSFSKKTAKGYVLEALIPASAINGYSAKKGSKIGMAFTLTIPSKYGGGMSVYWPLPKSEGVVKNPSIWGTVKLK